MLTVSIRRGIWTILAGCVLAFWVGAGAAWADDCNSNGIQDDQDIADGYSEDCNSNGVPDECDIDSVMSLDCQSNGVPDECELAAVNGLAGAYYDELDFQGPVKGRIDPAVDFQGGGTWPGLGIATSTFTVRWTGYVITPSVSGEYEFFTVTDDGTRLWVNGIQLVDKWVTQGPAEWSGTLHLDADSQYWIVMEYFEQGGGETAELRWQPPGLAKEIIPSANLIPGFDCNTNGIPDDCDITSSTSEDLYLNGVPDECEVLDCNTNGVPDDQDIAGGYSQDCNANNVPDECEIEWGWVTDCDESGIPDECEGLSGAPVLYVDKNATGLATGLSWQDAFPELRTALCLAAANPVVQEIRVATGIYTPAPAGTDRLSTFQLLDGLTLAGAYAGSANPGNPDERDTTSYTTILSGDLSGDDDGWSNREDNCFNVVIAGGQDVSAVLDGFTITAGNANGSGSYGRGGGIFIERGSPRILNCHVHSNYAGNIGGGVFVRWSDANLTECLFEENWAAGYGGGIGFLWGGVGPPQVSRCVFLGNRANHGGAISVDAVAGNRAGTISGCLFTGNHADTHGGALNVMYNSDWTAQRRSTSITRALKAGPARWAARATSTPTRSSSRIRMTAGTAGTSAM